MSEGVIASLEKLAGGPRDGPLLRYSLGNEYLKAGRPADAAAAFRQALLHDAGHSASWKLLGKALADAADAAGALAAWEQGIAVAEQRGDVQAAKEMKVFVRRLQKTAGGGAI